MVKQFLFIVGLLFSINLIAQTGIGTTTPHASAKLDVYSENKGFLPPRISLTGIYDKTTISSPVTGLLVYCKGDAGLSAGYYYWNGNEWATIATPGGSGSVAAEFGSQILSSGVTVSSATPVDVMTFTLPSAGTWEIITFLRAQGVPGFAAEFAIFDASNNIVPNSEILPAYGENASTGTGVVRITTNGAANYKVKAWASSGASYPYNVTTDANGRTGVTWKKISGNAPVTGQSVDYGIARYTGVDTGPYSSGGLISFDASVSGNLKWSGNKFTLKANKTYELESSLAIYQTGGGVGGRFQIYDYTNSVVLVNGLFMSQNGAGSNNPSANSPMKGIVTPTSDIQVGVRLLDWYGPAGPGIIGSTSTAGSNASPNVSYFIAKQIGSSAFVNPWVLNGSNVYNTTGNVGIGTNAPAYSLDVNGTAKLVTTPSITTATNVLVKDPTTSQISEKPISYITGIAKFIRNTVQTSITSGTVVYFNTTTLNTISNYVSLNTSTGVITLQPGTYELNGTSGAGYSANGGGDSRNYTLFHNGSNYIGTGGVVESGPAGNYNTMPQNSANCVITVPSGQTATITLKVQSAVNMGGISNVGDFGNVADAGRAWVTVRKYN